MLAQEAHRGQYRRNGDLYLEHPVAVALILAENGADADTVVAAVLHDGADPAASVSLDHVQREFGGVVSELLAAFTALDESTTTTPDDVPDSVDRRVLQLKVADRLHNMRTIGWLEPEKQCRKAGHIRDVVAPAARKIGLTDLAHELGDLAAATLRAHSPVLPQKRGRATNSHVTGMRTLHGALSLAAVVLAPHRRDRLLQDWAGELYAADHLAERLHFTASILLRLPHLALITRRRDRP